MAVFLLTPDDQRKLQTARELAVAAPIPLAEVIRISKGARSDGHGKIIGNRPTDAPLTQQIELRFGWRISLACEQQPSGLFLHLSMSTPTPLKTLPRQEAVDMVIRALGCDEPVRAWLEEFHENGIIAGNAINVLLAI